MEMIRLLGTIEFPQPVPKQVQQMVAYLAVHHGSVSRDTIADDLMVSQKTLRQLLWRASPLNAVDKPAEGLLSFNGAACDVPMFEQGDLTAYAGLFAPGWTDDWVRDQRARLEMLYVDLAGRAVRQALAVEAWDRARDLCHAALRAVPDAEQFHQTLRFLADIEAMSWLRSYGPAEAGEEQP